jgi:hypothetical protein
LGVGVLGFGDGGLGPIPNPQSSIPNPQSPIPMLNKLIKNQELFIIFINNINIKINIK